MSDWFGMKLHPTDISGRGFKCGFDIWKQPKFSVRMMWFFCFVCAVSSCPRWATYGWKKYRSLSSELLWLLKMIPWGSCWGVPMTCSAALATTYIPPELQLFLPPSLPRSSTFRGFFFSVPLFPRISRCLYVINIFTPIWQKEELR